MEFKLQRRLHVSIIFYSRTTAAFLLRSLWKIVASFKCVGCIFTSVRSDNQFSEAYLAFIANVKIQVQLQLVFFLGKNKKQTFYFIQERRGL